jgi:hypothetical protein
MVHRLIASPLSNKNEPQASQPKHIISKRQETIAAAGVALNYSLVMARVITHQARRCIEWPSLCSRRQ